MLGDRTTAQPLLQTPASVVELGRQETAEFYFRKLISPPASSLACLDFRFRKE